MCDRGIITIAFDTKFNEMMGDKTAHRKSVALVDKVVQGDSH